MLHLATLSLSGSPHNLSLAKQDSPSLGSEQSESHGRCMGNGGALQAILALQTGLRGEMGDADAWQALGCAYQSLGRLSAAVKASLYEEQKRLFISWTCDESDHKLHV